MSIDRSLRSKSSLERHRNVLTRTERIVALQDLESWSDEMSPFGLPKIANRKAKAGRKKAKKEEEEGTATDESPP